MGNCLAEGIVQGFDSIASELDGFRFEAIPLHLRNIDDGGVVMSLRRCDAVIMQRAGFLDQARVKHLLSAGVTTCTFPDIAFRSAWPFDGSNGFKDAATSGSDLFHDEDGALASLRRLEPDKKKRISRYLELDFPEAGRVARLVGAQKRFLQELDLFTEIKIGEFIEGRYRDEQLFYSSGHPAGTIFAHLINALGMRMGLASPFQKVANIDHWREWSVPIHPKVAQILGMKWANASTRYSYGNFGSVTWEEWVSAYIDVYG